MGNLFMRSVFVVALPIAVFTGGAWMMAQISGRELVLNHLRQHAALQDQTPLNQRLHYDTDAVQRHWGALEPVTLATERHFLELDLVFPLLYGTAFAVSLLIAWAALGRPFNPAWLIALIGIMIVSDWTENLVLLGQLRHFDGEVSSLQSTWIAVASIATLLKLTFFGLASIAVVVLAAMSLRSQ